MLLQIPDVLTADEVAQRAAAARAADWIDGRVTAGHQSAQAKDNLQLPEDSPGARAARRRDPRGAAAEPALHRRGAAGARLSAALQSLPGRAVVRQSRRQRDPARRRARRHRIRTDLSATLFFTGPDEYDGGELVIEDTYGVHAVKLPAGHLVLYPSTSLHHVRPVTRGARVASFFWIQSMVRDDGAAHAAVRSGHGDPAADAGSAPTIPRPCS